MDVISDAVKRAKARIDRRDAELRQIRSDLWEPTVEMFRPIAVRSVHALEGSGFSAQVTEADHAILVRFSNRPVSGDTIHYSIGFVFEDGELRFHRGKGPAEDLRLDRGNHLTIVVSADLIEEDVADYIEACLRP